MHTFIIWFTGFDYTNLLSAMPYSNYSEKFSQYFQFIRDNYNNSYESSSLNEFNVYDVRIIYIIRTIVNNQYC